MSQRYLILDYESRSEADLKSVGAWEYAAHPTTKILCAAWRLGTRENLPHQKTRSWCPMLYHGSMDELTDALNDPTIMVEAHNAFFERSITHHCLGITIPIERLGCTAALAASYAFPRNLAGVCDALKLPIRKDPRGKLLIRRHCIPRRPTKKNPSIWNDDLDGIRELLSYCQTDVDAEVGVFLKLPPLHPFERKVWALDQAMNWRGIQVDRKAVGAIQKLIDEEITNCTAEVRRVTRGVIQEATKRAQAMAWLETEGVTLPNFQKKTIDDALKAGLVTGRPRRFLELRQSISKTSNAKYLAFEARTRNDSRLRDFQLYHGASTGRFVGVGVQVHSLPRGSLKNPDLAVELLCQGDPDWVRALLGDPLDVASGCLRGMITASPGNRLYAGDFNAIEARVDFWLARHDNGLKLFGDGRDPYREMAAIIYRVPLSEVTNLQREVGKRAILGCGFGMGWKKFQATCEQFGTPVSDELAKRAVKAYRDRHAPVVQLWNNLERAAISAVQNPGKKLSINRTKWVLNGKFLFCELPSGRRLTYYDPTIRYEKTPWGEKRPRLYHWDVHPKTKQWVNQGTYGGKLCENLCQAVARDLMVASMLRIEDAGFKTLMSVHDEIVAEHRKTGLLKEFEKIMSENPPWAEGLPTKVKGFESFRYRKG